MNQGFLILGIILEKGDFSFCSASKITGFCPSEKVNTNKKFSATSFPNNETISLKIYS